MAVVKSRLVRSCILILGILSVALGTVGAFLPVLPTTPFILLAAWCFLKSSKKAHSWIYRQPLFGKMLRDWERDRSIARPTKVLAVSMIILSVVFIWLKVSNMWIKYLVTALLLFISIFISTRNEGR
ncbi:MAG: YbaN family protein [Bdellovibrionaceae bacterium]|jgi:uncharacterized protein|nr:YbaN family protein [Pseudobdellovibrionaceae bacterium]